MFRHHFDVPAIVLASCEMGLLYCVAYGLSLALRTHGFDFRPGSEAMTAALVTATTIVGMVSVGLYSRENFFHRQNTLSRTVVILPLAAIFMMACLYVFEIFDGHGHQPVYYVLCIGAPAVFFPLFLGVRGAFLQIVDRTDAFKARVLVLGSGRRAAKIDALCRQTLDRRFTIVGYGHLGSPKDKPEEPHKDSRRGAARRNDFWIKPEDLPQFCHEHKVDELVVANTERRGMPIQHLLTCKLQGITITEYADFWERESGQIDLEGMAPSWLVYSDGFQLGSTRLLVKRLFDIAVSSLLLLLTLPVTLLTAILIKLESKGPIFYAQERVGLHGQSFMILKFRSMREDAEKDGPRWAARNDNRVTRVGKFIRKVRIDEIPQVINVLKGEMAFVGPRPERPVFVAALTEKIPYYSQRHLMKPGITGWAQINYPYGATEEDARMKLAYDFYYIKNGSLFLDIITIMQTVKVVLWTSGAR